MSNARITVVTDGGDTQTLKRQFHMWQKIHSPEKSVFVIVSRKSDARPKIAVCVDRELATRLNPQVSLLTWEEFEAREGVKIV